MKRSIILYLTLALGIGALHAEGVGTRHVVDCGTWMELTATPAEDYHFVRWSDGNTDSVRQIQVHEDAHYVAFFAANCEEYANWPITQKYDWLLMLNVRAVEEKGYFVKPEQVRWYRIVGEPDDMHNAFPQDDQLVCTGYYLTIDRNLWGTGDYYCVADASSNQGVLCDGLMRSEIVHYAGSPKQMPLYLSPSRIRKGESTTLVGLHPDEEAEIMIFASDGKFVASYHSRGVDRLVLGSSYAAGVYQVVVTTPASRQVLRYVIAN